MASGDGSREFAEYPRSSDNTALIHRLGEKFEGTHPRPVIPDCRGDHQFVGAGGLDKRCELSLDRRR